MASAVAASMGREYPSQPVVGVGAVVLRRRSGVAGLEVLLVRRANPPSQGEWSLPGGALELGERLEEAAVREVREETGLLVEPLATIAVLDHILRGDTEGTVQFHYVLIDFVCRVTGGKLACATDALDACWASLNDLLPFSLRPDTLDTIHKAVPAFLQVVNACD